MRRPVLVSWLLCTVLPVFAACATSTPSTTTAPTVSVPSAAPEASAAPAASSAAAPSAAPAESADLDSDAGAPAQFRACTMDIDCVAVDRVGCCHNGWKEAVAASQKDAYARSFACPDPHPICAMYLVRDDRVAECDNGTHLCAMVKADDIHCGGFIRNQHACPDGYSCRLPRIPDIPGKCIKQ